MTKYPLCEELGLTIETRYILAADLERILSQAPVVWGQKNKYGVTEWGQYNDEQMETEGPSPFDTHTARLIGIKPIVKDTAESLMRDYLVEYEKFMRGEGDSISVEPWVKRVRKLLEGK